MKPIPSSTRNLFVRLAVLAICAGVAATLAACNTVKGAGRDIQAVGEAGERAIENMRDND